MEGRLNVRVPKRLLQAAQDKARAERVPLSIAIRWLVERWINGEIETVPPQEEENPTRE